MAGFCCFGHFPLLQKWPITGRQIFIHLQCWELLSLLTIQRQQCIKFRVLREQDSYAPLALNCQKEQHLSALEVYKNHSPNNIFTAFGWNMYLFLLVSGSSHSQWAESWSFKHTAKTLAAKPFEVWRMYMWRGNPNRNQQVQCGNHRCDWRAAWARCDYSGNVGLLAASRLTTIGAKHWTLAFSSQTFRAPPGYAMGLLWTTQLIPRDIFDEIILKCLR